ILLILALGGHFVTAGSMTLGELAAFNNYIFILIFPIIIIGFMSTVLAQATASYNRIVHVLEAPEEKETGVVKERVRGAIEVRNLHLTYNGKDVLKDISFSIAAGSRDRKSVV